MTELMESFTLAIKQLPEAKPITLQFLKQNVQINMGCTFHYNTRKTKRLPTDRQLLEIQKNQILPNLFDMWKQLKPETQRYWQKALAEAGITQPTQTPTPKTHPHRDKCHTHLHKLKSKIVGAFRRLQWKRRGV